MTKEYETGFSDGSLAAINAVLAWLANIGAGAWAATIHEAWEDGRIPAEAARLMTPDMSETEAAPSK